MVVLISGNEKNRPPNFRNPLDCGYCKQFHWQSGAGYPSYKHCKKYDYALPDEDHICDFPEFEEN